MNFVGYFKIIYRFVLKLYLLEILSQFLDRPFSKILKKYFKLIVFNYYCVHVCSLQVSINTNSKSNLYRIVFRHKLPWRWRLLIGREHWTTKMPLQPQLHRSSGNDINHIIRLNNNYLTKVQLKFKTRWRYF